MKESEFFLFKEITPRQLLFLAKEFSHIPGTCLLFSGSSFETAEKSYLWAFPFDALIVQKGTIERHKNGQLSVITPACVWTALQEELKRQDPYPCDAEWSGYLAYEMGAYTDIQQFSAIAKAKSQFQIADACFARCCFKAVLDHATQELTITIDRKFQQLLPEPSFEECSSLTRKKVRKMLFSERSHEPKSPFYFTVEQPFESASSFCQKVGKIKELIASGDIYQLHLSSEIMLQGSCDPFSLFYEMVCSQESSFFSFLRLNSYAIVSASCERFLRKRKGILESRPMSELAIIVDLISNDMEKVSHPGSVEIKKFSIEEYKQLLHRHALVQSQAKALSCLEILKTLFPGGSITGSPKHSAMNSIYELEQRRRGIYTGAIGYISQNGDFDFSIAIQTALLQGKKLYFAAGSSIVIDSDPILEYEELLAKAKSLLEPLTIHGNIA
jgi:para-aminobenzoate synthetase component 1